MSANHNREHSVTVHAIRKRLGREPGLVLWENSKVTMVSGEPRAKPGLCDGSSDLLGILGPSGRWIALEIKTGVGVPSAKQALFLNLIRARGGFASVVHTEAEAVEALERARAGASE